MLYYILKDKETRVYYDGVKFSDKPQLLSKSEAQTIIKNQHFQDILEILPVKVVEQSGFKI